MMNKLIAFGLAALVSTGVYAGPRADECIKRLTKLSDMAQDARNTKHGCRYFNEPCKRRDILGNPYRKKVTWHMDTFGSYSFGHMARKEADRCMHILDLEGE